MFSLRALVLILSSHLCSVCLSLTSVWPPQHPLCVVRPVQLQMSSLPVSLALTPCILLVSSQCLYCLSSFVWSICFLPVLFWQSTVSLLLSHCAWIVPPVFPFVSTFPKHPHVHILCQFPFDPGWNITLPSSMLQVHVLSISFSPF